MNISGIRKIKGTWDLDNRLMDLNFMNFMQPHLLMLFHCFVTANSKSQSLQCSHICHVCCFCSQFHKKCQTSSCPMSPTPKGHGRLAACWSELKGDSFGIALLFLSKTCVSKYIFPYACLYESFSDVGEIRVRWRADFQSGSRVLKKVFWTFSYLYLWHTMWFHADKVAENTQILKIAKFAV